MEGQRFKATLEWMRESYDRLNRELFDGRLGECGFDIVTGNSYRALGWFRLSNENVYHDRDTWRLYQEVGGHKDYVTRDNFVDVCRPVISMNGNYSGTEKALLSTMAHEMCHYYCYMDGVRPRKSHGREFMSIAREVSSKTNDIFPIGGRCADGEFEEYELDQAVSDRCKSRLRALFVFLAKEEGVVQITTSKNIDVINGAIRRVRGYMSPGARKSIRDKYAGARIYTTDDPRVIDVLAANGYTTNIRTVYRYYKVRTDDNPWVEEVAEYEVNYPP